MSNEVQSAQVLSFSGRKALAMARRRYQHPEPKLVGKKWVARWREDEILADGTIRRPYRNQVIGTLKEYPTKKLAQRELDKRIGFLNEIGYRPRVASNFEEFSERWQKSIMVTHKPSAQSSEKSHISKHLEPRWGTLAMKDIEQDVEGIQAWISSLKVGPKSVKNIVNTAKVMFGDAKKWGYVTTNPWSEVTLPQRGLVEEFALSLEQMRSLIRSAKEPYKTMYWVLGETGIRAGELFGLPVDAIDTENCVIHIRQSVWHGNVQTVKSAKGNRPLSISPQLAAHLKATMPKSGLLFVNDNNKPYCQDNVRNRHLHPLLKKLEIPMCGFHAFRHGNATLMDQLAIPMKVRQDRLGHEKPATTMRYTHSVDEQRAALQIGEMLTGAVQ